MDGTTQSRSSGFTLIELLVAISVIALLMSILLGALAKVRSSHERTRCLSNLRQIVEASTMYAADHDGFGPDEESVYTWDALLLPYVQDDRIYACPADEEGNAEELGVSYEVRDSFAVDIDHPERSFLRRRLLEAQPSSLIFYFELGEGWHSAELRNAAAVDGSARAYDRDEFGRNLQLTVTQ